MTQPNSASVPRTALIVDDFASVRYYHCVLLRNTGFACVTAKNGREAANLLQQRSFDIILLDLRMPEMNGEELIAIVRATPGRAKIPILVITTEKVGGGLRRPATVEAGAVDFVNKPCSQSKLTAEVDRLLREASQFR